MGRTRAGRDNNEPEGESYGTHSRISKGVVCRDTLSRTNWICPERVDESSSRPRVVYPRPELWSAVPATATLFAERAMMPDVRSSNDDDAALVLRVVRGDEQALGVLYDRWS